MVDEVLEHDFLVAASELVRLQAELLQRVEVALGVDPYDYWIRRSRGQPADSDPEGDDEWRWTFHGLEVDIAHARDGRFVQIDFGPRARRDVFTGWGIGLFVCHARAPWREFPRLRTALDEGNGYPNVEVVRALENALLRDGYFEPADPALTALVEDAARTRPDGRAVLALPRALQPETMEDALLCARLVLSESARRRFAGGADAA